MRRADAPTWATWLSATVVGAIALAGPVRAEEPENHDAAVPDAAVPDTAILLEVDRILGVVTEIRGLEPKAPIPADLYDRETLREVLLEKLAQEVTPERIAAEGRLLQRLGVVDESNDYYELIIELLTSQIAGFYDEDRRQLFLIDDLPSQVQEPTMAHELFHGIQDQLFGIETVRPDWEEADDAVLAATALIEGDAVGIMIDFSFGGALSFTDIPNFMDVMADQLGGLAEIPPIRGEPVPLFLQEELIFPYLEGLAFVHVLKSAGGWAAVDDAYLAPPVSTEQVLHPERYLDLDAPTWVSFDLPAIEQAGFERVYDSVFGEFRWRSLLRHVLGGEVAERAIDNATTGWDGDRLVALEGADGDFVLAMLSVWDDAREAREFVALLVRMIEVREHTRVAEEVVGVEGARWSADGENGSIFLERWGDMVLYLDGVPDGQLTLEPEDWLDSVWRGRSRGHYIPPQPRGDAGDT